MFSLALTRAFLSHHIVTSIGKIGWIDEKQESRRSKLPFFDGQTRCVQVVFKVHRFELGVVLDHVAIMIIKPSKTAFISFYTNLDLCVTSTLARFFKFEEE